MARKTKPVLLASPPKGPTTKSINEANTKFWEAQNKLAKKRLQDPIINKIAVNDIMAESARVPVNFQKSYELALEEAENSKKIVLSQQARIAGKSRKGDELQFLIEQYVKKNPKLSERSLVIKLEQEQGLGIIHDIDSEEIYFGSEGSKSASISGLKDRLSRAKRKLRISNVKQQ